MKKWSFARRWKGKLATIAFRFSIWQRTSASRLLINRKSREPSWTTFWHEKCDEGGLIGMSWEVMCFGWGVCWSHNETFRGSLTHVPNPTQFLSIINSLAEQSSSVYSSHSAFLLPLFASKFSCFINKKSQEISSRQQRNESAKWICQNIYGTYRSGEKCEKLLLFTNKHAGEWIIPKRSIGPTRVSEKCKTTVK